MANDRIGNPDNPRAIKRHDMLRRKHLVRNYILHVLEGGLYMGGTKFRAADSVLPVMVASLGGPAWLIGLTPVVGVIAWTTPALLVAHRIERLPRHLPLVLTAGVFQRLPFLLAALALILLGKDYPTVALTALVACPILSGITGGFGLTAWQEIIANTVPPNRRSSLWAVRALLTASIGLFAGGIVLKVVEAYGEGNPVGYGMLHLITFAFMVASYIAFAFVKETPYPRRPSRHSASLAGNLRQMPAMIRRDKRLGLFLVHRLLICGYWIALPFLAIHALDVLGKGEQFVGTLLAAQMAGVVCGNAVAGLLGDRFGGKLAAMVGLTPVLGACIWLLSASAAWQFWTCYFLLGAGWSMYEVGRFVLGVEICPVQRRASYLALIGAMLIPGMIAASQISARLWEATSRNFTVIAAVAAAAMGLAIVFLIPIKEPRTHPAADVPSPSRAVPR